MCELLADTLRYRRYKFFADEITRDYAETSITHKSEWKDFYLLPWIKQDFSALDYRFLVPDDNFFQVSFRLIALNF